MFNGVIAVTSFCFSLAVWFWAELNGAEKESEIYRLMELASSLQATEQASIHRREIAYACTQEFVEFGNCLLGGSDSEWFFKDFVIPHPDAVPGMPNMREVVNVAFLGNGYFLIVFREILAGLNDFGHSENNIEVHLYSETAGFTPIFAILAQDVTMTRHISEVLRPRIYGPVNKSSEGADFFLAFHQGGNINFNLNDRLPNLDWYCVYGFQNQEHERDLKLDGRLRLEAVTSYDRLGGNTPPCPLVGPI